jgi:hypothetical protein
MTNLLEKKPTRRTLLAMALASAGAAAFPINSKQEKNVEVADIPNTEDFMSKQDQNAQNVEAAKRFVGTWKGQYRSDAITDNVFIFKMEGNRLKGTTRSLVIRREKGSEPQIVRDEYVPLPDLDVKGKTLSWKNQWSQPDHETLRRITLISDDEILYESVGTMRFPNQPTLIVPISFKLKREK